MLMFCVAPVVSSIWDPAAISFLQPYECLKLTQLKAALEQWGRLGKWCLSRRTERHYGGSRVATLAKCAPLGGNGGITSTACA